MVGDRFLYCEESHFTFDLVLPTLYASKKYIVPLLTEQCLLFLEENLDVDNVCLIYEQSKLYDEIALMEKCKSYIETRTEDVLNSVSFLNLSGQCFTLIRSDHYYLLIFCNRKLQNHRFVFCSVISLMF